MKETFIRRMLRRHRSPLALGLLVLLALLQPAHAQLPHQVTGPSGSVGPPAPGPGSVRGRIVPASDGGSVADLKVILYSLKPDGTPGLANAVSDTEGRFTFNDLSNEPNIVYLLGTSKDQVPFGQRFAFAAGQTEIDTEIELQTIRDDPSGLRVSEVTWLLEWMGSQLLVQAAHQIRNESEEVIFVAEPKREDRRPLFTTGLPDNMEEFLGSTDGLTLDDSTAAARLVSWGPFYPGEQEVRYGFLATADENESEVTIEQMLPLGATRTVVLVPLGNPPPKAPGLVDSGETTQLGDKTYARFVAEPVAPGGTQRLALSPPPSSQNVSDLRVTRTNYWIDHDDTQIRVNAEVELTVDSAVRLVAPTGQSLLHISLPEGAEFQGLTGASGAFGIVPGQDGGLDIRGPLPPGNSTVGYRYRLAAGDTAAVDLRVSREVETLNLLVADNGVLIESERLHRQRPFKQGTRFYLHRQAYHVDPGEAVRVKLTPLGSTGLSTNSARLAALGAGVLAVLFLLAPLRAGRATPVQEESLSGLGRERESIYESIRDLQDDFETGKLDEDDYRSLRVELHANAVELLRQEQALAEPARDADSKTAPQPTPVAQFCTSCGVRTQPDWKFCSDCGAPLNQAASSA